MSSLVVSHAFRVERVGHRNHKAYQRNKEGTKSNFGLYPSLWVVIRLGPATHSEASLGSHSELHLWQYRACRAPGTIHVCNPRTYFAFSFERRNEIHYNRPKVAGVL
jgi:hypothetical protein